MPSHKRLLNGTGELAKRKNELWYRRRLRVIAEDMKDAVATPLKQLLAGPHASSDPVDPAERAALAQQVARVIADGRSRFEIPVDPQRTATYAARMNLQATDVWFAAQMKAVGIPITPAQLPQPQMDAFRHRPLGDAAPRRLTAAQLRARLRARARLGLGPVRGLATLGVIAGQGEIQAAFQAAVDSNVGLITSIPDQYFDRMQEVMFDHMQSGQRWETLVGGLRDAIDDVNNLADYRVALIARDQTSKMAATFNEARTRSVGISQYTWQTAGDERVRESHAANDGQVFSFDTPPEETGNPGDDVNCRCVAIPYVEEAEGEEEAA